MALCTWAYYIHCIFGLCASVCLRISVMPKKKIFFKQDFLHWIIQKLAKIYHYFMFIDYAHQLTIFLYTMLGWDVVPYWALTMSSSSVSCTTMSVVPYKPLPSLAADCFAPYWVLNMFSSHVYVVSFCAISMSCSKTELWSCCCFTTSCSILCCSILSFDGCSFILCFYYVLQQWVQYHTKLLSYLSAVCAVSYCAFYIFQ